MGESTGRLALQSSDLGSFYYNLHLKATTSRPEKPLYFCTTLGSSQTITTKITNYTRQKTDYLLQVTPACPGLPLGGSSSGQHQPSPSRDPAPLAWPGLATWPCEPWGSSHQCWACPQLHCPHLQTPLCCPCWSCFCSSCGAWASTFNPSSGSKVSWGLGAGCPCSACLDSPYGLSSWALTAGVWCGWESCSDRQGKGTPASMMAGDHRFPPEVSALLL